MEFFKKRTGALLVAVAIISLSTLYGAHRSLGAACQEITDSFYSGVYDQSWGTTRTSINSQLIKRQEAALGIISIASSFPELESYTDNLRSSRDNLIAAKAVSDLYDANFALEDDYKNMISALSDVELSDSQRESVSAYSSTFKGAQNVIDSSGYNEAVRDFSRSVLNVFPTNLLRSVTFVNEPELFDF